MNIDYFISTLCFNANTKIFYGETHLWCKLIYYLVPILVTLTVAITIILLIITIISDKFKPQLKKQLIIILLSLAIGPGLIVNTILKNTWGRPRPYQVLRDGAKFHQFYQVDLFNKQNNSFPSGHASIGFFLGSILLIFKRHKSAIAIMVLLGGIIGLVRILQGGHYLSDVIFSGIIVWSVTSILIYSFAFKDKLR